MNTVQGLTVFAFAYLFIGHIFSGGNIPAPGEAPVKEIWKQYFRNWKEAIIWPYYLYKSIKS